MNPPTIPADHATGFLVLYRCPCFWVSVESRNLSPSARLRVLLLRVVAGLGVESSVVESNGADVEDVL